MLPCPNFAADFIRISFSISEDGWPATAIPEASDTRLGALRSVLLELHCQCTTRRRKLFHSCPYTAENDAALALHSTSQAALGHCQCVLAGFEHVRASDAGTSGAPGSWLFPRDVVRGPPAPRSRRGNLDTTQFQWPPSICMLRDRRSMNIYVCGMARRRPAG